MHLLNRKLCRLFAVITIMAMSVCQNGALAGVSAGVKFNTDVPTVAAPANPPCHAAEDEGQNEPRAKCESVCHSALPQSHIDTTIPAADLVQQPFLLAHAPVVHVVEVSACRFHDSALTRVTSPPPTLAYCRLLN